MCILVPIMRSMQDCLASVSLRLQVKHVAVWISTPAVAKGLLKSVSMPCRLQDLPSAQAIIHARDLTHDAVPGQDEWSLIGDGLQCCSSDSAL